MNGEIEDMITAICSWVDMSNHNIMRTAIKAGTPEMPNGGWKVLSSTDKTLTIMRREDGKRFLIIVEEA